jgi:2-polyprenyl-6-methoxyphenol hydroxylase-like FAD-dependent oxidoreductase
MINIIGGGIAGLTCSIVLSKLGIKSEIFEKSSKNKLVSGSLTLYPNSIRILKHLDLFDDIANQGWNINHAIILNSNLKILGVRELGNELRYGEPTIGIKRQSLIDILYKKTQNINFNKEINNYDFNNKFSVISDGSFSINRRRINKTHTRNFCNIIYFGGYIYCNDDYINSIQSLLSIRNFNQSVIVNGPSFISFSVIKHNKARAIYWYTHVKSEKPLTRNELAMLRNTADISRVINANINLPHRIIECLQKTNEIVTSNIYETYFDRLCYSDRYVIIGDAAHSINPLSGQGAGMAIEDAYVFGNFIAANWHKIKSHANICNSLNLIYKKRNIRIKNIQKKSNFSSKISALNLPKFLYYIRDRFISIQLLIFPNKYQNRIFYRDKNINI